MPWASCFRLTACSPRRVSHGCVVFLILTHRLGMLSSAMCSSFSVRSWAPSEGGVQDKKFHSVSSISLESLSQSASLKCQTSRWCDAVSGTLNFTVVRTPLWSATAATVFAVQSVTSVITRSRMYWLRVGSLTFCCSPSLLATSKRVRPSTLSRAECLSHRIECTFKSPSTNTPTAPSLY